MTTRGARDRGLPSSYESLLSAHAVRERTHELLARAERGESAHFQVNRERLSDAVTLVIDVTRSRYPDLAIPFHSRWRHFEVDGVSRWPEIRDTLAGPHNGDAPVDEHGRIAFELAITSVLLDAGAGAAWRYQDTHGRYWTRSEGLAMASFDAFAAGLFSSRGAPGADAAGLAALDSTRLEDAFQVTAANPLVGLPGRAALLRSLGAAVAAQPHYFPGARLGGLCDVMVKEARHHALRADDVLGFVLRALGRIWPGRLARDGVDLGDVWPHPALGRTDTSDGLVPLHKLSQWLTYSLLEPLEWAGARVTSLDGLTGLAEYRNGGLLLDTGALALRDPSLSGRTLNPGDEVVVEWRALTVALLDDIAASVRTQLGMTAASLPLASVLEGGTWAAGRVTAARLRDGLPPLDIASDGTLF